MAVDTSNNKRRRGLPAPGRAADPPLPPAVETATSFARMLASCALAGIAVALSFAPFGLFPLAWIGVAVLFVCWERGTLRQAAPLGFAFGLGLFGAGGYWLYPGLMRHGGYSMAIALAGTAAVVVVCSAHVALAGLARVFAGAPSQRLLRLLVVMPCAWVVGEWLRTGSLTGWLSLGYGQIDGPLAGYAPVGGVQLVSFASALLAGALALLWLERSRWRWSLGAGAVTLATAWPVHGIEWTSAHGRALEVAAVQGNVASDIKWAPDQLQPSLDLYANATLAAAKTRKLDAVIWPETAITARPDQVAPFLAGLQQAARAAGITVIFGIIDVERGSVPRYFNAALATGTGGGTYYKRHLVPLTEYMPAFLPQAWQEEKKREAIAIFSPGADVQAPIRIGDVPVGTTICYETSYGGLIRDPEGIPELLLSLTNDDWFMGTTMPAQDNQVARMRALESGREMLHVANSGITAWIDARGRVISELRVQERATLFARMQPRNGLTPYWRWGEWAWAGAMLIAAGLFAMAAALARRTRRPRPAA